MPTPAPTTIDKPTKPKGFAAPRPSQTGAAHESVGTASFSRGRITQGERIGIYGPGGLGKTELVAGLKEVGIEPLFIDLDQGSLGLDVARGMVDGELVHTFDGVRAVLQDRDGILKEGFGAVVIDTFSALEDVTREWVLAHVPHEKRDRRVERIEDYGFGKGYQHIFETALLVLQDLDALCRMGVHVVLICHQCAQKVPSAETEDFLEYQPRLQSPTNGKLRERVFEWTNHFFRVDHDRSVDDGKVARGDVRSIHTIRTTTAWAKHRSMPHGREFPDTIAYPKGGTELWEIMFGSE
jgi:hypothetical protein